MQRILNARHYVAASVALITFIVYLPALQNGFVNWDDDQYIYDNPFIRSFDAGLLRSAFLEFHVSNWHPLAWLSHALDYALWGLNPMGHHLTNNVLHALNASLVVSLVVLLIEARRMRATDNRLLLASYSDRGVLLAAAVTGLLFGIHPLHVESVAWVSERKDLLCAFFFLLSMISYTRYADNLPLTSPQGLAGPRMADRHYLMTIGLFVLALLSKPMAVSLPVVLLILDWYPLDRLQSRHAFRMGLIEKIPFVVLSLVSSVTTVLAQSAGETLVSVESVPLATRVLVAAHSLVAYLWEMMVPVNLLPFYPHVRTVSPLSVSYGGASIVVIAVTLCCLFLVKRQKVWLSAWCYYVVTLIPVLGIVQAGGQSMADRYTYLPSLGPFLMVGLMAAWVSKKAHGAQQGARVVQSACAIAGVLVFALLAYQTIGQIGMWRDSIDLWSVVIKKEPGRVPLAYYNRGQAYMNMGKTEKAIEDYTGAIASNPLYRQAYFNRGVAFEKLGRNDLALQDYEKTISLDPSSFEALNNRGVLFAKAGSYDKAIESFNLSVAANPDYPSSYFNRGFTYFLIGRYDEALADFNKTIELNPQFGLAYLHRGNLLLRTGREGLAVADFRKACELGIREACSSLR